MVCYFFFFSSRRRHTRFDCDWSSDVCSSDLGGGGGLEHATQLDRLFEEDESRFVQLPAAQLPHQCVDLHQPARSEEHTSELQSQSNLVCRLLLEKKKTDSRNTR